jgi:hypothetical protein
MCEIKCDVFNICNRIKKINPKYRIYYNCSKSRFEVHTTGLEFVVPYPELDSRTIEWAQKTRKENDFYLEREIEKQNSAVENAAAEKIKSQEWELQHMLEFANRANRTVDFTKNYLKEF